MKKSNILIIALAMLIAMPNVCPAREKRNNLDMPKPLLRGQEFLRQRGDSGSDLRFRRRAAIRQMERLRAMIDKSAPEILSDMPEWENIGPSEIGGRIKSVVTPSNGVIYIGAAAGGVWKSTDAGQSWTPLFDRQNGMAMGSIAIHPENRNIIFAATGEAVIGGDNIYLGCGMVRSTDGGQSWSKHRLTEVGAFSKIYIHPEDPRIVVAGGVIRKSGFYVSTDAGGSWQRKSNIPVTDITFHPEKPHEYIIAGYGEGIFKTTDLGESWEDITINYSSRFGRISVQRAKTDHDYLYALAEAGENALIHISSDGGQSWSHVYSGGYDFFNGQGFYNNFIEIHPGDKDIAFAGGIDLWKTTDGGDTWRNITHGYSLGSVHVDQHHLAFDPVDNSTIYLGNDGGMYKSTNLGEDWEIINNGLQVTQFYAMAIDNSRKNVNYGGTQDNGTLGNRHGPEWKRITTGDGFKVIVDPENPDILYGEYYFGDLWRKNLATNSLVSITSGIPHSDKGAWEAPLIMDPFDNKTLYHGRTRVYRTTNSGDKWTPLTDYYDSPFSAIEVSPVDNNIIYAGTELGRIIVSTDGGNTWSETQHNGSSMRYTTDIKASLTNKNKAWVTFSGYGSPHVYKTTDAGLSWQKATHSLPDVPVSAIEIHPENDNAVFIGTDIGVFASFDDGASWLPFSKGLPRSPVTDLEFHTNRVLLPELTLRASTHGRSMWEVNIPENIAPRAAVLSPTGGEVVYNGIKTKISWTGLQPPCDVGLKIGDTEKIKIIASDIESDSYTWIPSETVTDEAVIMVNSQSGSAASRPFAVRNPEPGVVLAAKGVEFRPYGMDYSEGKLYVCAFDDQRIYTMNPEDMSFEGQYYSDHGYLTDLDRRESDGAIFAMSMNNTSGSGGRIVRFDSEGNKTDEFTSPVSSYPVGLELTGGGMMVCERDGAQRMMLIDPEDGSIIKQYGNPMPKEFGPRTLSSDPDGNLYHINTAFPNITLSYSTLMKLDSDDPETIRNSFRLEDPEGTINARGVAFDSEDSTFWISDYDGIIFKVSGFAGAGTPVGEHDHACGELNIYPNPARNYTNIELPPTAVPGRARISLINSLGRIVGTPFDMNYDGDALRIDTSPFAAGLYSVKIRTAANIYYYARLVVID